MFIHVQTALIETLNLPQSVFFPCNFIERKNMISNKMKIKIIFCFPRVDARSSQEIFRQVSETRDFEMSLKCLLEVSYFPETTVV